MGADDIALWEAVLELILRPPARLPLDHVTSLDDAVRLIEQSQKIIVLSGAGVSEWMDGMENGWMQFENGWMRIKNWQMMFYFNRYQCPVVFLTSDLLMDFMLH